MSRRKDAADPSASTVSVRLTRAERERLERAALYYGRSASEQLRAMIAALPTESPSVAAVGVAERIEARRRVAQGRARERREDAAWRQQRHAEVLRELCQLRDTARAWQNQPMPEWARIIIDLANGIDDSAPSPPPAASPPIQPWFGCYDELGLDRNTVISDIVIRKAVRQQIHARGLHPDKHKDAADKERISRELLSLLDLGRRCEEACSAASGRDARPS